MYYAGKSEAWGTRTQNYPGDFSLVYFWLGPDLSENQFPHLTGKGLDQTRDWHIFL